MPAVISENWLPMLLTAMLTAGTTVGGVTIQISSQGARIDKLEENDKTLVEELHAVALGNWTEDDQKDYQKAHREECQLVLGRIHEKLDRLDEVLDKITEEHIRMGAGK